MRKNTCGKHTTAPFHQEGLSEQFHNPIEKLQKEEKSIPQTRMYMKAHFPGFVWVFQ
jgi:hypothetical protein